MTHHETHTSGVIPIHQTLLCPRSRESEFIGKEFAIALNCKGIVSGAVLFYFYSIEGIDSVLSLQSIVV